MNLFYTPDINSEIYTLTEDESKHIIRVLRMKIGSFINLTNGNGTLYNVEIIDDNPKRCTVKVVDFVENFGKRNFKLHIAIAPTKNLERIEWFLEKATEIGIDEITPLICRNSERDSVKIERLNKVVVSAMKQSLKAFCPVINEPIKFSSFIKNQSFSSKFIAHCADGEKFSLKDKYQPGNDTLILIGPEGDFSIEEIKQAFDNQFEEIHLGKSRLRTETAGVVACQIVNFLND
ncbi:MAG: 16S rRNA (uracil(1498)-N(3))-methyltransferase [Bacteroidetes bacterium]|nr:16S rRNA (uracil(1498)-N(3))-methyltransferase [Bacteroidota bacterium]